MQPVVIVPTFNEADNIEQLVTRLIAVEPAVDVVVVDDASPDGTGAIADRLALKHEARVSVIHRRRKGGRGGAVMAGLTQAFSDGKYDRFVEMDADLSHLPEELGRLLAASESVDVVIGSRYVPGGRITGWSVKRRAWSKASNALIDRVLRLPIGDYTNGYRVYSRQAVERLLRADLKERGYISLSEWAWVLHRSGLTFADVPITFVNRRLGASKMSLREVAGAVRALLRMRMQTAP